MKILQFNDTNLALSLSNKYTSEEIITSKNHFIYFKGYLNHLNTKTIIIEEDYINKDFLHDYASYYAFCFEPYPKFCKRVHFFDNKFSEKVFKNVILSDTTEKKDFWDHYLGFIVIKPIPLKVIGYSLLKTYSNGKDFNKRNFWGCRDYKIHIFGNEIKLFSLAFQEQDTVLAACATTAIWSMLNKASADFHTTLKSPSEITQDADNISPDGSRLFPNKGLDISQICNAIFRSGLVSEVKKPDYSVKGHLSLNYVSNKYLKKILNAYSPIGIPIILVISVPIKDRYGLHAIAISGFKMSEPKEIMPQSQTSWLSDNINKIYAHDDQWGSFVKIDFKEDYKLVTPWTQFHDLENPTFATNIIVPLYPKIRISYEDIESVVLGLDSVLSLFFNDYFSFDLVWDIKVDYGVCYKERIKTSNLIQERKIEILLKNYPKYIWIASCYVGEFKIFDFIFDATDVNNGMIGKEIICYLPDIKEPFNGFINNNGNIIKNLFKESSSSINYYNFLLENFKKIIKYTNKNQ